jgi:DMSO/TMAO reductase YedYZ molybdopterin-dependent catalytic subunit
MRKQELITTRRSLLTGLASLGGIALAGCAETLPPSYGNVLRMGDAFTYRAQRLVLGTSGLAKEYGHADITSVPAIGTTNPGKASQGAEYERLRESEFADYRLAIEGSVARPAAYSLEDLKRFAARTQITKHTCEEGWSAISEWTGVSLRRVLEAAGIRTSARFVTLYAFDGLADSIDMFDALHPQTILAYGMNGRTLPIPHGAPLRLRVETQLGYKSMKFIRRIVVSDAFEDGGAAGNIQNGWSWYAGI